MKIRPVRYSTNMFPCGLVYWKVNLKELRDNIFSSELEI